jgi:hypothetical protein
VVEGKEREEEESARSGQQIKEMDGGERGGTQTWEAKWERRSGEGGDTQNSCSYCEGNTVFTFFTLRRG